MSKKYERKLILIGLTGNGKSSLANVLLGRRAFEESEGFNAVTKECKEEREVGRLSVVDTPGLFDCNGDRGLFKQALGVQKAIKVCPNPHAFLIVLDGSSRLRKEELSINDILCTIFGKQCLKRAIIVLTHIENRLEETQLRERLQKSHEMRQLINQCENRFARIENKDPKREHIKRIIELVDEVSREGRDTFENDYMHVHERVLLQEAAIKNQDSGPVHEQIKRLFEKTMKAVEEKKEFKKKCVSGACVAASCIVATGAAGLLYVGGDVATVAAAVASQVVEKSVNIATWLRSFVSSAH